MTEEKDKLAKIEPIMGTHHLVTEADEKLKLAASLGHLASPATRVGSLPPGCGVAISVVRVDPSVDDHGIGRDVFDIEGKRMLQAHIMNRISTALGVNWDPIHSRRLDNGKDPNYCHFQAVGQVRLFDGQWQTIIGNYELDLREGSPYIKGASQKRIDGLRKYIVGRCETGARARAVSGHGVRRSYLPAELEKPFIVAKLHFDGSTDDPVMAREYARLVANSMLGGPRPAPVASGPALSSGPAAPPALEPGGDIVDEKPHEPPPDEPRIPYGTEAGKTLSEASLDALEASVLKITGDISVGVDEPGDRALLEAIDAELSKRKGSV